MIALKQCNGGIVYPKDDAILNDLLLGQNGIIYGCEVTQVANNVLRVSPGYGVIKGRMFEVTETDVVCILPDTGEANGELFINMSFEYYSSSYIQFETKLVGQGLIEKNENINFDEAKAYGIVISTYKANSSGITNVNNVRKQIKERIKILDNKTVPRTAWEQAYGKVYNMIANKKYQYQACIALPEIDDYYIPNVYFSEKDVELGIYSPLARIIDSKLYIAAKNIPDSDTLIEVIECIRKGGD